MSYGLMARAASGREKHRGGKAPAHYEPSPPTGPTRLGAPVPPDGPGVCRACHGPAPHGRGVCWSCRAVGVALGVRPDAVPVVVPAWLYRPGDPLHRVLRRYKHAPAAAARRYFSDRLAETLDAFLSVHADCVRRKVSVDWDTLCVVPSAGHPSAGHPSAHGSAVPLRVPHPFEAVVARTGALAGYEWIRLASSGRSVGHLAPSAAAFVADDRARGSRVLLLDDTWTTGAHVRSAVAALERAGATVAAIVVAGRYVDPGASPAIAAWWASAAARSSTACCLCLPEGGSGSRCASLGPIPRA